MDPDQLCDEYRPKQSLYREFGQTVAEIIRQVLLAAGLKTYATSSREKDIETLREKVERKKAAGTEYRVLDDIEDLSGVRVVAYLESHREQVTRLVYEEFKDSCVRFETKYEPEGYRGTHLVVRLNPPREALAEYSRYKGLKCEIQVSSILYHAWSEIEHDVIYKPGADREKLKHLGLDEIEASFQKIMAQHLEDATIQFDLLYKKHQEVLAAGKVIYSDYISDIRNATSNDEILSILDIADKFAHKKPEAAVQMAEEALRLDPMQPQVIGNFGKRQIHGKSHEDVVEKSLEILDHVRYWDVERILRALFRLSIGPAAEIAKKALEIIKRIANYDSVFLKQHKNLYPQESSLEFLRKLPLDDRQQYMPTIGVVMGELLSCAVEGTEWTSADTLTFHSGALVPNDGLKRLRQEAMLLASELYRQATSLKDRVTLIRSLLEALEAPHYAMYGDDLIQMIQDDSKRLVVALQEIIFVGGKISEFPIAQEIEESLIRVLRNDRFKNDEIQALYERIQEDKGYVTYCALVGDIHEFRSIDEDWKDAEQRRMTEVDELVAEIAGSSEGWYERLNAYAEPYQQGVIDEWKYQSFRMLISKLTEAHSAMATALLVRAIDNGTALSRPTFVAPYLLALRRNQDFTTWDAVVASIRDKQMAPLMTPAIMSLNVDAGANLATAIRESDVKLLEQLVKAEPPFEFTRDEGVGLRYALMITLTRLFEKDKARLETLLIEEMKLHAAFRQMQFHELPFASHRKWMSFRDWSPEGIGVLKTGLAELPTLEWQVQGMMLELGEDPIALILDVFKARLQRTIEEDEGRYEQVPYHFNPELRKYIAEHPGYVDEMVKWLREMTPKWSSYNWHVAQFIQRIGGASYSTILMKLIETGDRESLDRAADALNSFEGADFELCFEIVKRTDDKDILSQVSAAMRGTGVVTGENGLALAFESKAKALEQYAASDDARTRAFAVEMRKIFAESARTEHQRSTVSQKARRLRFEGS